MMSLDTKRCRYITVNMVTAGRLGLACLFPFCGENLWLLIVLAAALSDLVDGWLARRWQAISWQGGIFDAVVDKVFTLVVFSVFAAAGKFSFWWLPVLLQREMVVGLTALILACNRLWSRFRTMTARPLGKLATASQFALAITVPLIPELTLPVLTLTALLSTLAAIDYWRIVRRALRAERRE
jgi:cardiolipin synthase (CMP-forming)